MTLSAHNTNNNTNTIKRNTLDCVDNILLSSCFQLYILFLLLFNCKSDDCLVVQTGFEPVSHTGLQPQRGLLIGC